MGLIEGLKRDTVEKLALRKAITVDASTTVRQTVEKMREEGLGCAIIVDTNQKPTGVFTEAMLRRLLVNSPEFVEGKIQAVMAEHFPWVQTTDTVDMVLDAMELKNTRFVVVVDSDGKVCGLTGQKGLMEYVAEYFPGEVMVQRIGTKPYPSSREGA